MISSVLKLQLRLLGNLQISHLSPVIRTSANRCVQNFSTCAGQNESESKLPEETTSVFSKAELTPQLVHHLERTSLVDFESSEALARLTESINFAQQLFEVNTDGVEPLVSVLENESLYLRDDVTEKCDRKSILQNATVTEEDYFVAPPGNVPLQPSSSNFLFVDEEGNKQKLKG